MKVATFLLNEKRKLSPNEAMREEERAYSRAVLVDTDAVAFPRSSAPDTVETTRIASTAHRISKIE
jgi:hypothetical protein